MVISQTTLRFENAQQDKLFRASLLKTAPETALKIACFFLGRDMLNLLLIVFYNTAGEKQVVIELISPLVYVLLKDILMVLFLWVNKLLSNHLSRYLGLVMLFLQFIVMIVNKSAREQSNFPEKFTIDMFCDLLLTQLFLTPCFLPDFALSIVLLSTTFLIIQLQVEKRPESKCDDDCDQVMLIFLNLARFLLLVLANTAIVHRWKKKEMELFNATDNFAQNQLAQMKQTFDPVPLSVVFVQKPLPKPIATGGATQPRIAKTKIDLLFLNAHFKTQIINFSRSVMHALWSRRPAHVSQGLPEGDAAEAKKKQEAAEEKELKEFMSSKIFEYKGQSNWFRLHARAKSRNRSQNNSNRSFDSIGGDNQPQRPDKVHFKGLLSSFMDQITPEDLKDYDGEQEIYLLYKMTKSSPKVEPNSAPIEAQRGAREGRSGGGTVPSPLRQGPAGQNQARAPNRGNVANPAVRNTLQQRRGQSYRVEKKDSMEMNMKAQIKYIKIQLVPHVFKNTPQDKGEENKSIENPIYVLAIFDITSEQEVFFTQKLAKAREQEFLAVAENDMRSIADLKRRLPPPPPSVKKDTKVRGKGKQNKEANRQQEINRLLNMLQLNNRSTLDMIQLRSEGFKLSHAQFAPEQMVKDVIDLFQAHALENKNLLTYEADQHMPNFVTADRTRIQEVIFKLLFNAMRFTSHGIVKLICKFVEQKQRLEVTVIDTGMGIDNAVRKELFKPPSDSSQTLASSAENPETKHVMIFSPNECFHIKMLHVRLLVAEMGGEMTLLSKKDQGSIFTFHVQAQQVIETMRTETAQSMMDLGEITLVERLNIKSPYDQDQDEGTMKSVIQTVQESCFSISQAMDVPCKNAAVMLCSEDKNVLNLLQKKIRHLCPQAEFRAVFVNNKCELIKEFLNCYEEEENIKLIIIDHSFKDEVGELHKEIKRKTKFDVQFVIPLIVAFGGQDGQDGQDGLPQVGKQAADHGVDLMLKQPQDDVEIQNIIKRAKLH